MPPKKREKELDSSKNPRIDHIQADHELFLQAFEKPTQIYRYLRTRNMCSPIFLNRTLTYMRYRMSRTHKSRQTFKVDSLLERITSKQEQSPIQPGFINITFLGFTDRALDETAQTAQVETVLLKISHKKRKESSAPTMQLSFGTAEVPVNPDESALPPTAPTISIPTDSFNPSGGPLAKSYIFLFRVKVHTLKNSMQPEGPSGDDTGEPLLKRRKSLFDSLSKIYGAELTVYDKHNRCYLADGDYDVVLQDFTALTKNSPKKHSSWESGTDLVDSCANIDLMLMQSGALLKFKLNWAAEASAKLVDRPPPYPLSEANKENIPVVANAEPGKEKLQIVYQFVYNNNSRQQTEACEDLHCPWCSLNADQLYTLLKHLKLCHSRFAFTYAPIAVGARIDVAINELYDGSYTGSPHDLASQPSACAFSRQGPVRRACVTHILVCHPRRAKPQLGEFLELDDCEYDGQRPFITGHNRLYHHTTTCLPIYPKEMDADSEGEGDPEWLRSKTMTMIDEFTDVNEGEKELMKMWNLHVMRGGFVGDCQIPVACQMFVQQRGAELLMKNLYKNFVVHMGSLFDFGLVSAVCLYSTVKKLQEMVGEETGVIRNVLKEAREAQIENWARYGGAVVLSGEVKVKGGVGRKAVAVGVQRRKGAPTPVVTEAPIRRKSVGETARKRLSLSLNKIDQKSS